MKPVVNQAFVNAGQKPGVEIWRIENFEPVPYSSKLYGKFYEGDSYIILKTTENPKSQKLSWDIHFWLGADATTDEAGAAAICTIQLDDQLEGAPVQHREVQDHESQLFLSYFKNGVRYEKGGVATGFGHVDVNAAGEKRLFQVKGKRNVRVRQVELSIKSMNRGDCFILDAGDEILVYVGEQAKRMERLKAIYAANEIRDQDHHGRSKVNIIDNFSSDVAKEHFFTTLGSGSADEVAEGTADEEDGVFEEADIKAVTLYKVSDASGSLEIEKIAEKPLRQEMLHTDDSFILDAGTAGIYVWVGRNSTQREKRSAMDAADHFLDSKSYPPWTQVHRVVEDGEPAPFKQYFSTWHDQGSHHKHLVRIAMGYSTDDSDYEEPDDVDSVVQNLKKSGGRAIAFMPDNGENDIEHIIKFSSESDDDVVRSIVEFDGTTPLFGHFAYVITYKYSARMGETGTIMYVWEGGKASDAVKERSFNDGLAMAREQEAILVRTAQSHEPRHFLKIFKGKLITPFNEEPKDAQLFRVRGTDVTDVHASEVNCDASSLASGDVFALVTPDHKVYIWVGQGASDFEKSSANEHFAHYWPNGQTKVIQEGAEPCDFWEELHGEGEYDRSVNDLGAPLLEPRLFHCKLVAWRTKVEEVRHFEQSDLDVDDVMLLDAGDEIYVWVGSGANEEENVKILHMVKKYIKQEPTDRTVDSVSVIRITQGKEPRVFTRMFPTWDKDYWKVSGLE
ncbi:gelsolin-like [Eurosta solidaginis]|uniref:gelsolin-like n=1 Tax=Eurosta solidaginis TaxID=178769 RepID=UPI0035316C77